MSDSDSKAAMYKAFAAAQAEFVTVKQTAVNPFFKSKYAELSAYVEMVKPVLKKHGFSFSQPTKSDEGGVSVKTVLYHESGELIESEWLTLKPDKNTPQGAGSAITYARRYSLTSFLGLVSEGEDDDGNAASAGKKDSGKKAGAAEKGATGKKEEPEPADTGKSDKLSIEDSLTLSDQLVIRMDELLQGGENAFALKNWWAKHTPEIGTLLGADKKRVEAKKNAVKKLMEDAPTPEETSDIEPF